MTRFILSNGQKIKSMKNFTKLIQGNQKASLLLLAILFLVGCSYFQVKKIHAGSLEKVVETRKIYLT